MQYYFRFLKYLKPYKAHIALTWMLSVLVVASQGISVWVGAGFLQKLFVGELNSHYVTPPGVLVLWMDRIAETVLQRATPFASLITGVSVLISAAVLTALLRVLKSHIFALMAQTILVQVRSKMFAKMTQMDLAFSSTYRPGEVASLFIRDVDQLRFAIIDSVDRIFMQPLRLVMAFLLMASLSIKLTLWIFFFLIISSLFIYFAGNRIEKVTRKLMEKSADLQGRLTEYLSAVILARSLGREKYEQKNFVKACKGLADTTVESNLVHSIAPQSISTLFVMSGGLLLLVGGYMVLVSKTMNGAVLIRMTLLVPVATYPIESLAFLYLSIRTSIASARRIYALLDREPSCVDLPNTCHFEKLKTGIVFDNVCYSVNGVPILKDIAFTIPKGSRVVVYGPSGAGKTTLMSLIAGFIRPTAGQVRIDGVSIDKFRSADWRRHLGIVIQEPILLNGTVRENLLYASPDADENQLEAVLRESLLWGDKCVFAQGIDTPVGNRGDLISGGERQRLTIARSLLNKPEVLLLDEPTAMLDNKNKKKIKDTICAVSVDRTLIIVTHDPFLMEIADIHLKINAGILTEASEPPINQMNAHISGGYK